MGDRVTAPIEDIWREKIRGAVTGEATRLLRSRVLIKTRLRCVLPNVRYAT
jgi:hypothetical protein